MKTHTDVDSWSRDEALAVALEAFSQRLGTDLLWQAFRELTIAPVATMDEQQRFATDIDKYLAHVLYSEGDALVEFMNRSKVDRAGGQRLLFHCAVRWWLARDALVAMPPHTRVNKIYAHGSTGPHAQELLAQMLYRGKAPDTSQP